MTSQSPVDSRALRTTRPQTQHYLSEFMTVFGSGDAVNPESAQSWQGMAEGDIEADLS
jgi:hypothetical protein